MPILAICRHRVLFLLTGATAVYLSAARPTLTPTSPSVWEPVAPYRSERETSEALNDSGVHAWRLFIDLNRPALSPASGMRGQVDPTQPYGSDGWATWQTWKYVTEVFRRDGSGPGPYNTPPQVELYDSFKGSTAQAQGIPKGVETTNGAGFNTQEGEVRINQVLYDDIVKKELFSIDGQEAWRRTGKKLSFPPGSIEVKASWKDLGEIHQNRPDRSEYHLMTYHGHVWGLRGLHVMSKDLPNWFWCTFEHYRNPEPVLPDQQLADIEPRSNPEFQFFQPDPKRRLIYPVPTGLMGTKWRFYRLRGVMTDFTGPTGIPNRLSSAVLEFPQSLQSSGSCMSCHAKATIGSLSLRNPGEVIDHRGLVYEEHQTRLYPMENEPMLPPALPLEPRSSMGVPDPSIFGDPQYPAYTQLDYVYALYRAHRRKGGN